MSSKSQNTLQIPGTLEEGNEASEGSGMEKA
eukprot:CAMPEP_0194278854 /NCGR_PEP_ID=MMETSP0169-20130528/12436_1 /TAXON_ID=218684 /ORGANISM="Corethron pennatum, Strain L29A3" /LENGTH=30 /DNA_ID= /DNA_START= /DNA_END= /DNA_ORIENTATION=